MLTGSYLFSQPDLIMEVLRDGIFDIVSPCQPWQDTIRIFSDAFRPKLSTSSREWEKEDAGGRQHYSPSHPGSAAAWVQFIAKYPPWKYVSIWQPRGGLGTAACGCLELNLALLSSRLSVPRVHGSSSKGLLCWQTCGLISLVAFMGLAGE